MAESPDRACSEGFDPPAFEPVDVENDITHNGAPDRFLLWSGGMDSTAMCHYLLEEEWATDQWGAWNKRPLVVYLETTIGLSSQRLYTQLLADEYNWQLACWRTQENFDEHSEEEGFYGPDKHGNIFNVVKGRQIGKMTTIAGNPHVYFGSRVAEKGEHVKRVQWSDDYDATVHNPIYEWSDADVVAYLEDRGVPFNPNWDGDHPTDCACGATAAYAERFELECEGYEVFVRQLEDIEAAVETGDRRETWGWGSFDPDGRRILDAKADDGQMQLSDLACGLNCSGRSKALQREGASED